jgi:hypothetical protein
MRETISRMPFVFQPGISHRLSLREIAEHIVLKLDDRVLHILCRGSDGKPRRLHGFELLLAGLNSSCMKSPDAIGSPDSALSPRRGRNVTENCSRTHDDASNDRSIEYERSPFAMLERTWYGDCLDCRGDHALSVNGEGDAETAVAASATESSI